MSIAVGNVKLMIHIVMLTQLIAISKSDDKNPPHIIVIVIDDLGEEIHESGIICKNQFLSRME